MSRLKRVVFRCVTSLRRQRRRRGRRRRRSRASNARSFKPEIPETNLAFVHFFRRTTRLPLPLNVLKHQRQ